MRKDTREARRAQIEDAAFSLLAEKGFAGTSVQAIARRASASNETLYRWYGDKTGLFRALIDANARTAKAVLQSETAQGRSAPQVLAALGPVLLDVVLGDRAIALNRAAAADASGELGQALAESGRNSVVPLIVSVCEAGIENGDLQGDGASLAALWLDLLLGDQQVRRVTGAMPACPDPQALQARSDRALHLFLRLAGPA